MKNKFNIFISILLGFCLYAGLSKAAEIKVQGDPELIWLTPLGKEDIENTAYNRCKFIRVMKPGIDKVNETTKNTYDVLSNYISNLYAQSIKISAYVDAEEKKDDPDVDLTDEKILIDELITRRLGNIARRINIINSFEAGMAVLSNLLIIDSMPNNTYETFRTLNNGQYEYVSDCSVLK